MPATKYMNIPIREGQIFKLLYGLTDGYALTVEDVADLYDCTSDHVRMIEGRVLRKLELEKSAKRLSETIVSCPHCKEECVLKCKWPIKSRIPTEIVISKKDVET